MALSINDEFRALIGCLNSERGASNVVPLRQIAIPHGIVCTFFKHAVYK